MTPCTHLVPSCSWRALPHSRRAVTRPSAANPPRTRRRPALHARSRGKPLQRPPHRLGSPPAAPPPGTTSRRPFTSTCRSRRWLPRRGLMLPDPTRIAPSSPTTDFRVFQTSRTCADGGCTRRAASTSPGMPLLRRRPLRNWSGTTRSGSVRAASAKTSLVGRGASPKQLPCARSRSTLPVAKVPGRPARYNLLPEPGA